MTTHNAAMSAAPESRYYVREHHPENGTLLGFWMYLMSDCLIFACLFATYAVLGRNYAGGPTGAEASIGEPLEVSFPETAHAAKPESAPFAG